MGLNKVKKGSQMYQFIDYTWNTIKGACYHDCTYCYMKRWGKLNPVRFDEKELKTDLGTGNFIFVGSSCDMFAGDIPYEWVDRILRKCKENYKNRYLFQSKNPFNFTGDGYVFPKKSVFCTTIETNRHYDEIMRNAPEPHDRAFYMPVKNYITIEPIMKFDLNELITLIKMCKPIQVNIGADSGKNNLPEPSKEQIFELIAELNQFTKVKLKKNLNRLLK